MALKAINDIKTHNGNFSETKLNYKRKGAFSKGTCSKPISKDTCFCFFVFSHLETESVHVLTCSLDQGQDHCSSG